MKRVLTVLLIFLTTLAFGQKSGKPSKQQKANMTPEQRMVSSQKKGKKKKPESTKAKVKRAKKQDKAARKQKKPKKK